MEKENSTSVYLYLGCVFVGISMLLLGAWDDGTADGIKAVFFLVGGLVLGASGVFFIWIGYKGKISGKS